MIRLFRVSIPASIVILVISETILLAGCFFLTAFRAFNPLVDPWFYFQEENGWVQLIFAVASIQLGLYFMDLYDNPFPNSRITLIHQLCLLLGVAFMLQAIIGYGDWFLLQLPQWTMIYGSLLILVVIPAWRIIFFALVKKAIPSKKLLFFGMPPVAQEVVSRLVERPETGYAVVGYIAETADPTINRPYLGSLEELDPAVAKSLPEDIVISVNEQNPLPTQKLLELRLSGVGIKPVADLYEEVFARVSIRALQPSQIIFSPEFGPKLWTVRIQTIYSYLLGLIGLIVSLPLIVISAVLVKLSSPGPVFYRQQRVGLRGEPFYLYKFRSMYIDAETRTGPVWATKNDPRITPIGRWLRKLRLDELPQFFNVLRGEMVLVGPRPERPEFCSILGEKIPFYNQRHVVKPGITGWAQINHRYADTVEDTITKLEYDLYYVKHLAPALDAYIIFHTAKVMLLFRGAQ